MNSSPGADIADACRYRVRKGCETMIQLDQIRGQMPELETMLKEAGESL